MRPSGAPGDSRSPVDPAAAEPQPAEPPAERPSEEPAEPAGSPAGRRAGGRSAPSPGSGPDKSAGAEATMQVFVRKALTGQSIVLLAEASETILSIKAKIQTSEFGPHPREQRLVYRGRKLKGNHSLSDYNICTGSTLDLVIVSVQTSQVLKWQNSAAPVIKRIVNKITKQSVLCMVQIFPKDRRTKRRPFKRPGDKGFIGLRFLQARPAKCFCVEITFEVGAERHGPIIHDFAERQTCLDLEEWDFGTAFADDFMSINIVVDEDHRVEGEAEEDDEAEGEG